MPTCKFLYKDNLPCNEPVRVSEYYKETLINRVDPNSKNNSEYFQAFHEAREHDDLCYYHQRVMAGTMDPFHWSLIPEHTRAIISKNRAAYEQSLIDKKKEEMSRWKNK